MPVPVQSVEKEPLHDFPATTRTNFHCVVIIVVVVGVMGVVRRPRGRTTAAKRRVVVSVGDLIVWSTGMT